MFKKVNSIFLVYYGSFNTKSGSNVHILELLRNLKKYSDVVLFAPSQKSVNRALSGVKYVPVIDNKYLVQPSYEFMLSFYLLYSCIKNRPDVLYLRQNSFPFFPIIPVSYTHLRAHETDSYLVCRPLPEKKNGRSAAA